MTSTLAMSFPLPAMARRRYGGLGDRASRLTRSGIAVERVTDRQLLAAHARRVLLQQVTLRPHQLGGVILLHLLLQRTGCRCRRELVGVDGVRRRRNRPIIELRCR